MKNSNIVDRVVERIKLQPLGDLITEEDLFDIVKEAIPKAFFEKQIVVSGSYNNSTTTKDPLIVEIMRDLLHESAQKAASEWVAENNVMMAEYWQKVLDDGVIKYVQSIQDARATALIREALAPMMQGLNNERSRSGLPPLYL